jgi:hypothetical protein
MEISVRCYLADFFLAPNSPDDPFLTSLQDKK